MRAWALVFALLLAAAMPAGGQEELYSSWKSSLEALKDVVGEGIWGEIASAKDLREAVLAQERALSKLRPKLESLPQPTSLPERRDFEEQLESELSEARKRLIALGILEALQVNDAVKWMKMVAEIREAWSARLVSLLVAQELEEAGDPEKALQRIEEVERRIAEAFELSEKARRSRQCIVEFREGSSKALKDLKICLLQPQPIPVNDPKIGEKVFLQLSLQARKEIKMEPSMVVLKITGDREGRLLFKDVAKMTVGDTGIMFKVSHQISGNIVVGGITVYLRGDNGETYEVSMPCSIATGACARIMVFIPGYDGPMPIKAGTYSVDLEISWEAEDRATGFIEIFASTGYIKRVP